MARTAIRHAIYSAAAAQYRFPVSPHPQEPMSGGMSSTDKANITLKGTEIVSKYMHKSMIEFKNWE
eukprot:2609778-Rhodomonas_salina.1